MTVRIRNDMSKTPESLAEKLKDFGPRYLRVSASIPGEKRSGKNAFEHGRPERLHNVDNPELQAWLAAGGNYEVAFGEGTTGAELDNPELHRIRN